MRVILGADHAGVASKDRLKAWLGRQKIPCIDMGSYDAESEDDYVDYAEKVARHIARHRNDRGILICGTGTGMVIAANKIKGVRASVAYDQYSARMARHDNDTNILALRGRHFPYRRLEAIVATWLATPFSGEPRHRRRVRKIRDLER